MKRHVIILGCPRSGTTFLSRLLETIPNAESLVGTLLPVAVPQVAANTADENLRRALALGFERSVDAYLHSSRYISRAAALQKWLNAPTGLRGLAGAWRRERHADVVIYKEPMLAYAPQFVLDAFPDAKIIHIFRDGRDCANSLVASYDELSDDQLSSEHNVSRYLGRQYDAHRFVPWWVEEGADEAFIRSSQFARCCWMWKAMVRRCYDCFDTAGLAEKGRLLNVKYEALMHEPEGHGKELLEFIGLEPSKGYHRILGTARTSSIGKHKSKRTAQEIAEAEQVAGSELRLYGYETGTS